MPSFAPREQKTSSVGRRITLYRDSTGSWYVGAPGDADCHPMPMGAFMHREGARRWADHRFPGGTWGRATKEARLPAGTHLPRIQTAAGET